MGRKELHLLVYKMKAKQKKKHCPLLIYYKLHCNVAVVTVSKQTLADLSFEQQVLVNPGRH